MKDKLRDIHQTDLEKFRIKKSSKLKQKEKENTKYTCDSIYPNIVVSLFFGHLYPP